MFRSKFALLLFTVLWFGFIQTGKAHDPGLSRSGIQILSNQILLHLTFARRDIESIIPLDSNRDEKVSVAELNAASKALTNLFTDGIDLRVNEKTVPIKRIEAQDTNSDAITLALYFPYQGHEKLSLAMPFMEKFSRGHRHHLTLQNSEGELLQQYILKAGLDAVLISGWRQVN